MGRDIKYSTKQYTYTHTHTHTNTLHIQRTATARTTVYMDYICWLYGALHMHWLYMIVIDINIIDIVMRLKQWTQHAVTMPCRVIVLLVSKRPLPNLSSFMDADIQRHKLWNEVSIWHAVVHRACSYSCIFECLLSKEISLGTMSSNRPEEWQTPM